MLAQFKSWDDFEKKDFVYICNATGYHVTNLIPIFHLNRDKIKAIAILAGDSPRSRTSDSQATKPAKWLYHMAKEELGLDEEHVCIFHGNPEQAIFDWSAAITFSRDFNLPILYNATGGTVQMSLAVERALNAAGVNYVLATIDKTIPLCRLSAMIGNSVVDKVVEPPHEYVPIDLVLSGRGFESRLVLADHNDKVACKDVLLKEIFNFTVREPEQARIALQATGNATRNDRQRYDAILPMFGAALPAINFPLAGPQHRFLTGEWLERFVCNELTDFLLPDVGTRFEVTRGVEIYPINAPTEPNTHEIDVFIRDRETFYFVEVKQHVNIIDYDRDEKIQQWIDRASTIKSTIGGIAAISWIWAPFLNLSQIRTVAWQRKANAVQVKFVVGTDGLEAIKQVLQSQKDS